MPFSVALMTKANLGLSMIAAPTYIISEKIPFLTYGQTEYFFQALVLALMCIAVKKFKWTYLTSFITAVIYGSVLDGCIFLLKDFNATSFWLRAIIFVGGMVLTAIGVAFFFHTYLAPCAYDFFVRTVVQEKKLDLRKFKLGFDFSFLIIGIVLTVILFQKFIGITWGTLIIAICNGNIISFCSKFMDKHIEFFDRFPLAKYF